MSEGDKNKAEQLSTNSGTSLAAADTNTEMPALESAFRALEEIANEDFNTVMPEIEGKLQTIDVPNAVVGENIETVHQAIEEKDLEHSAADTENFTTAQVLDNIDALLQQHIEAETSTKQLVETENITKENHLSTEESAKESLNTVVENTNETDESTATLQENQEETLKLSSEDLTSAVKKDNLMLPTDDAATSIKDVNEHKLELSSNENVESCNKDNNEKEKTALMEVFRTATETKEQNVSREKEDRAIENNESLKDVDKTEDSAITLEKSITDENVEDKSSNIDVAIESNDNVRSSENIEPMDTCDSQESTNLVIDETSNITETKDDNKTDDDTTMEVDLKENTKDTEESKPGTVVTEDKKKETDLNEDKTKDASDSHYKSKDDDVIPIEQPPVPIIEIDDEDDMETESETLVKDHNTGNKAMDVDNTEKELNDKNQSITQEITCIDKKTNASKETKEENSNILLEKTSEEPFIEQQKPQEEKANEEFQETNDEVFYNKECINYECPRKHKQYFKVPQFAFSYFKVTKKKFKIQYICADCYDKALDMYEEYCGLISAKQPLLLENIPSGRQEFVEIIDSSDDEDTTSVKSKSLEPVRNAFSKNDLSLIESELHDTIKSVLNRVEIQNQLTWSKTILMERLKRLEMETDYVDNELKTLQRKADKMHEGLYSCPKIKIRQLQPLDLNSGKPMSYDSMVQKEVQPIPPVGEIERPPIQAGNIYFAVKNNPIASWVPCRVIEQVENNMTNQMSYVKLYKIKFIKNQTQMPKNVPAKYLAYYDPPAVRLPIGTRVIAYFDATSLARGREKINVQSAFYPGIIAEPLKPNNKFRYLIFYDDGYTQYVYHKDVRLVCHVSDCVWEDVHPASRDFIQKYLTQYSINRPMVQTQKGQSMNTESNGYWLHARVVDIDCSLVLMQFEGSKSHTEWIYRGSLRLGPVFKEYQKSLQKNANMPVSRLPRRTEPFIRYTEDEETSSQQQQQQQHHQQQQQTEKSVDGNRAVARKTFGRPESMMNSAHPSSYQQPPQPAVKHLNNSTIYVEDENKPKGKVVYYTAKRNLPPRKFKPHQCTPSCLFEITHNLSAYSPLSKPLLSGWERFIIRQKIKRVVTYRAPCGKILRNMKELHHYLRATNNVLNVDNFDFSHEISCLAEYVIESAIVQKRDISNGQEKMAIPLVNYYDNTLPPECKYSAKVIPTEGVHINTDPAFLVGCDCEDDCMDKSKCACWQLTLAGAKYGNPNMAPEEVGYQYRRLLDHVPTGIYECNVNCKCKSSCLNRVVQNSLTMKLQVFKTSNRGWGLRCINDIPRGSFVCVYAGHLLTEAKANEGGQDAGDEYFAELDYIEVAEQIKEGYESEVEPPEPEEEDAYNPEIDDDDFTPSKSFLTRAKLKQTASKSTKPGNQEDDSQERQVINFNPNADMNEDSVRENSIRKLYGKDEACYVMDAKISGNLGRYFNHSCAPNMFVQNVFVDTHDLRFPNVAFFASCNIRAGTELTWNYNYEVGVVPGKVLYCQCGAPNCRLRLL